MTSTLKTIKKLASETDLHETLVMVGPEKPAIPVHVHVHADASLSLMLEGPEDSWSVRAIPV